MKIIVKIASIEFEVLDEEGGHLHGFRLPAEGVDRDNIIEQAVDGVAAPETVDEVTINCMLDLHRSPRTVQ